jgi:YfiH family protein
VSDTPLRFELPGGGHALFTDRAHGDMSTDGGERAVRAREGLRELLGVEALVRGHQVHGSRVQHVREMPRRGGQLASAGADADGQLTAITGLGVMVLAADCLPVALASTRAVAMLHAGWRGLGAGVLERGVAALRRLGADEEIVAVIGPGAGVCCYEVGPEVHLAFGEDRREGPIDLRAIAGERLHAAGVSQVRIAPECTICDESFFSHRREGPAAGRQAGVAWRS